MADIDHARIEAARSLAELARDVVPVDTQRALAVKVRMRAAPACGPG